MKINKLLTLPLYLGLAPVHAAINDTGIKSSVTLTAAPATGKVFAGWAGDCTGTVLTCMLNVTAAKNVIAIFN